MALPVAPESVAGGTGESGRWFPARSIDGVGAGREKASRGIHAPVVSDNGRNGRSI